MIEPTDEMEDAMVYGGSTRERLAAVLAIVERDYELLAYCNAELMPGVVCKLSRVIGHAEHKATGPSGSAVKWS